MTKFSVRFEGMSRFGAVGARGRLARSPEESTGFPLVSHGGGSVAGVNGGPPPVALERSSGSTRRRVIEAGARVFADLGFHAATKERIGAAAGFSHQTVRDYFRTKEALLGAIVADAWRTVLDATTAQSSASALDQLMAAYDALDTLARTRPAEARCVLHEAQIAGPKGAPMQVDEEREFFAAVERIIAAAAGLAGAAATARAEAIVAAMQGLARTQALGADAAASQRYTSEHGRQSFRAVAESLLQVSS